MSRPFITEPPEELARLREDLIAFYRPASSQERFAIERIALAQQSMLRAARLETCLFAAPEADPLQVLGSDAFKIFLRYQEQAQRAYRRALDELLCLQANREPVPAASGQAAPAARPQPVPSAAAPSSPPRVPARPPLAAVNPPANLALRL